MMILMCFHLRSAHEESVEYLTYDQQEFYPNLFLCCPNLVLTLTILMDAAWGKFLDLVFQAMVGDLGGYLGLFLGWSLYSLLAEVGFYFESILGL